MLQIYLHDGHQTYTRIHKNQASSAESPPPAEEVATSRLHLHSSYRSKFHWQNQSVRADLPLRRHQILLMTARILNFDCT
jgi:hypothetical protein